MASEPKQLELFDNLWRCKTVDGKTVYVRAKTSMEALGLVLDKQQLEFGETSFVNEISEITVDAWTDDSEV